MIFFSKDYTESKKYITTEKELLSFKLKKQEKLKELVLLNMQDFATSPDDIDISEVDIVSTYLENLKHSLQLISDNITSLNTLITNLTKLEKINDNILLEEKVSNYNEQSIQFLESIEKNELKIYDCIYIICKNSNFIFPTSTDENPKKESSSEKKDTTIASENNQNEKDETKKSDITTEKEPESAEKNTDCENQDELPKYENTLVVSEKEGTVILPYQITTIEELLKKHPKKYSSLNDIIQKEYTIPLKNYKNPFISRFKEGFKLIRTTEKGSIGDSFSLGLELMFNTNLHPAIITACKNLDELDIYLDYLESGKTDEFDCFKIVFEFPPAII